MAKPGPGRVRGQGTAADWTCGRPAPSSKRTCSPRATSSFNADNPDEAESGSPRPAEVDRAARPVPRRGRAEDRRRWREAWRSCGARSTRRASRLAQIAKLKQFAGEWATRAIARFDQAARRGSGSRRTRWSSPRWTEMNRRIESKAVYTREPNPIPPTAVPDDGLTSLLFAPRFDHGPCRASSPDRRPSSSARPAASCTPCDEEIRPGPLGRPHRARHRHHAGPRAGLGPEPGNGPGRVEHRQPVRDHRPRGPRRPAALAPVARRPVPGPAGPRRPERLRRARPTRPGRSSKSP